MSLIIDLKNYLINFNVYYNKNEFKGHNVKSNPKVIGNQGERLAAEYLKQQAVGVLTMNYYCPYGEVDIIGTKEGTLIFFEVKTRTSRSFGYPEESITSKKKKALINSAMHYIQETERTEESWRIDVVAINMQDGDIDIKWIENAITC